MILTFQRQFEDNLMNQDVYFEGLLSYYSMKNHSKRPYFTKIDTEVGAYEKYDEIIC